MITTNVISRVYYLKFNGLAGTCFTIDFDKRRYFVTAKHIIETIKESDKIELYHKEWESYDIKLVGHAEKADISVFTIDTLFDAHPVEVTVKGLMFGLDVFYLGFPFEYKSDLGKLNRGFPMALVKKGIISGISLNKDDGQLLLIDSISSPGFSGAPIIFTNLKKLEYKICGVISKSQFYSVDQKDEDGVEYSYLANTGIVLAYSIDNAIDLIKLNPIGYEIPSPETIEFLRKQNQEGKKV